MAFKYLSYLFWKCTINLKSFHRHSSRADVISLLRNSGVESPQSPTSISSTMIWNNHQFYKPSSTYQHRNSTSASSSSSSTVGGIPFYQTNFCYVSVFVAFILGLIIGVFIPIIYYTTNNNSNNLFNNTLVITANDANKINNDNIYSNSQLLKSIFINNSYSNNQNNRLFPEQITNYDDNNLSSIKFIDTYNPITTSASISSEFISNTILTNTATNSLDHIIHNHIYWGPEIEKNLPSGYGHDVNDQWTRYIDHFGVAVRLENGCGRMQNRLITFKDGQQACVRYRQNTDQIQGELFSFYLAQILKLPNLAPSTISIVDLQQPIWQNLGQEISTAQWNSNRPVVLTKYISNLDSAHIPNLFKPLDRHLNKFDVHNMTRVVNRGVNISTRVMEELIELAQWSDLIIFDYLTANLDRIVNNLYNYQWNINIMDAPAHNLAQKIDTKLLLFLDNESGLLHGYRLLKKYEIYHILLLDNLCMFRQSTADIIKQLKNNKNIGHLLNEMFEKQNSIKVRDVLPTLPDKSIKVLNERIERVHSQIEKCQMKFSNNKNNDSSRHKKNNSDMNT